MIKASIPAWRNGRYVSLAELLLVLGRLVLGLQWRLRVFEVAPGPGEAFLAGRDPSVQLSTLELMHLVTPDVQVIDGDASAFENAEDEEPLLVLVAVDSTSWDIRARNEEVIDAIRAQYPDAMELLDE